MSARVLIVDDLFPNIKLLETKLTIEYFDVVSAMNAKAHALTLVRAFEEAKGNQSPSATTSVMKNSGTWNGQERSELLVEIMGHQGLGWEGEAFDKDEIDWRDEGGTAFYRRLVALKHRHPALAAAPQGGTLTLLPAGPEVIAFERRRGADVVRVAVNLSAQPQVWEGHALPAWGWEIA